MWISPNHPNPPRRTEAPQEQGRLLERFERGDGVELRATLAEFEGHPYISLRVWEPGDGGELWPCKGKGLSIRLREVDGLVEALREGAALAREGGGDTRAAPSGGTGTRPRGGQPGGQRSTLPAAQHDADFDEFG